MHMSDQNGGDVYNHSGMPTISAPNIGSALSTGAKYAGIGVGAAIASPFAITAGLGYGAYGVGKAVGKSIGNYTKRTTSTPGTSTNNTTKKKPSSSASNSVSKLPRRIDAAVPVPGSSTLPNPNMQGAMPGLNNANLPTALPVGNLPTAFANGMPSNFNPTALANGVSSNFNPTAIANGLPSNYNPTALANGIPGMPSNYNPANMQQMAQNALTPDAIKKILEEETAKIKREIMHLPFAKMLMGQKEKILLKVDKEGAQERLCNFFYKRLQKILDTSQIINDDLDIIYGYSVNQIYTANEKVFREYSTNQMCEIIDEKVKPLFDEARAIIKTWDSSEKIAADNGYTQQGGDPERGLSKSYKSFLDDHEKEMVSMFELQTGEMIDIDDAVQVQQVILHNIFKTLDINKNKFQNYNEYMRNIVLHPKLGILEIFRKQVNLVLNSKQPPALSQDSNDIENANLSSSRENTNLSSSRDDLLTHDRFQVPQHDSQNLDNEHQNLDNKQFNGGATGDFKDHYQVPDYMPSGHDWHNLKYCITKKVASDVQASIESQAPKIKQMFKNIIYFQLHSYLTDYGDSVPQTNIPAAVVPGASGTTDASVVSEESGATEAVAPEASEASGVESGLIELVRKFVIKYLDNMCSSLHKNIATQIFKDNYLKKRSINGYLEADQIDILMERMDLSASSWPFNYFTSSNSLQSTASNEILRRIEVKKYKDSKLDQTLGNELNVLIVNPPSDMLNQRYSDVENGVPNVFKATKIDSKKFKQNLWYRGLNRFGKYVVHSLPGKTPVEKYEKEVLDTLEDEERTNIQRSPVGKHTNFTEGAISSFLFYQSHPYMLKIIYDKLEPVFRSISLDYDENFTRIFYYSSITFMRTVANSMDTPEVQKYIKQYVARKHVVAKKLIDKWAKFFRDINVIPLNGVALYPTRPEKIAHWTIFALEYAENEYDIPTEITEVMKYFENTFNTVDAYYVNPLDDKLVEEYKIILDKVRRRFPDKKQVIVESEQNIDLASSTSAVI